MKVTVTGDERDLPDGTTVGALVEVLGVGTKGVAVARNQEVVPRSEWDQTQLTNGDHIEVLHARQGG